MKLKNFAMITEDKVTEIFCIADDFCKVFDLKSILHSSNLQKIIFFYNYARLTEKDMIRSHKRSWEYFYLLRIITNNYNIWNTAHRKETK